MAKEKLNTFQKQIKLSPEAHTLSVAMGLLGISVDIPTADMILLAVKAVEEDMTVEEAVKAKISHDKKWSGLINSKTNK